jgi:ribosomal protein S17
LRKPPRKEALVAKAGDTLTVAACRPESSVASGSSCVPESQEAAVLLEGGL